MIYVSALDKFGYFFGVGNGNFSLFKNSSLIGSGILIDGLYKLHLKQNAEIQLTLHGKETNGKSSKNDSYFLWHKKLGHISNERIKRLVKDGVLLDLDFANITACVNCIKGKTTKKHKERSNKKYTAS